MNLNSVIFPAPESSYEYRLIENILWIPKTQEQPSQEQPGQEQPSQEQSSQEQSTLITDESIALEAQNSKVSKPIQKQSTQITDESIVLDAQNSNVSKKSSKSIFGKFIGKKENKKKTEKFVQSVIPCLSLPYKDGSDKIILYFHGNSEDIGWAYDFTASLRDQLKVNVISMEYPGYGLYIGEPSADKILDDAEILFDYIVDETGVLPENIMVFGRSIGSGPATYLASRRKLGALFLMSPYTSIKAVAKGLAGKMGSSLVAERFRNIDEIQNVKCPALFIHGQKDKLIPFSHTVELLNNCPGICDMNLPENMTHNDFVMEDDVTKPILKFLSKCGIKINLRQRYPFPEGLYEQPEYLKGRKNKRTFVSKMSDKFS